ncbi:MAG: hypothetical protein SV375_13815 [Thermodesulfobacteriota bacterium]|nr:hypothetical protein [Thermodesulfobacteriota bacterium]
MIIEVQKDFPLVSITPPEEKALQKELTARLLSKDPRISVIPGNMTGPGSDTLWEKGSLVDIYI